MASPQWNILSAVKTTLEGLASLVGVTVVIRDEPFHSSEHGDPNELVVVSPLEEKVHSYQMPSGVWVSWPVVVSYFQAKSTVVQSPTDTQRRISVRWEAFQALGKTTLAGVPSVFNFDYDPDPELDVSGRRDGVRVSNQVFTYLSAETRGGGG